jgi:mono/diheme cytochrome c family protein
MCATGRLHDPESWYRVTNLVTMVLQWNVIWKFLFFVHVALATTGAAILFFFFRWHGETTGHGDDDYVAFVRKFAGGLAIAFTLSLPVWYLFYIFTTPDVAFDQSVYWLAAALVLVAMVAAFTLMAVLGSSRPRFGTTTFSLFMGIFLLMNVVDQRTMVNANLEHATLLSIEAEREKAEREAEIEAKMADAGGVEQGEEVFKSVCMQCHRFDSKLVGPPLNDVLPNYAANPEALHQFLANPTKRNPDYPPMPNPGLTQAQIRAVSEYVLSRLEQGNE